MIQAGSMTILKKAKEFSSSPTESSFKATSTEMWSMAKELLRTGKARKSEACGEKTALKLS